MAEKKTSEKNSRDIKLEDALKKLGEIVGKLEGNECELDEALKFFEEGVSLARACHTKLDDAEKKIEILTRADSSGVTTEPFKS